MLGDTLRRISLRIHGDKHEFDLFGSRSQLSLNLPEIGQGYRANVRAVGVAEENQHHLPTVIAQAKGPAVLVLEAEVLSRQRRFDQRTLERVGLA